MKKMTTKYRDVLERIEDFVDECLSAENSPILRLKIKDKMLRMIRRMAIEGLIEGQIPQFDVVSDKQNPAKVKIVPLNAVAEGMFKDIYDMGRGKSK